MGTKVKGLVKGIKSLSLRIFDDKEEEEEEEEEEIQIGQPTDVKHLAHIGSDAGVEESPSWMKGFDPPKDSQSGSLEVMGHRKARRNGSSHRSSRSVETSGDTALLPKSSRNRHRSVDNCRSLDINTLETTETQGKTRHPRRHQSEGRSHSHGHKPKSGDELKTDSRKKSTRRRQKTKEESSSDATRSPTKSRADDSDIGSDIV
ncbi:hypothetical protein LXL04_036852 [Taraxacum kok-saghyz]